MTAKQELFIREYLVDLNATQAAVRAGYSATRAANQGSTLLKIPAISSEIARIRENRAEAVEIDAEWVLKRLIANHEKAARHSGPGWSGASTRALELIGKHLAMFTDKVEQKTEHHLPAEPVPAPETYEEWARQTEATTAGRLTEVFGDTGGNGQEGSHRKPMTSGTAPSEEMRHPDHASGHKGNGST